MLGEGGRRLANIADEASTQAAEKAGRKHSNKPDTIPRILGILGTPGIPEHSSDNLYPEPLATRNSGQPRDDWYIRVPGIPRPDIKWETVSRPRVKNVKTPNG